MSADSDIIRSAKFRAEREGNWQRLDAMIDIVERRGLSALNFEDASALVMLYRQAVNALSVARAISLDRSLVIYLETLCARAYLVVYAPRDSLRGLVWRYMSRGAPQAARRSGAVLLLSFGLMALGAVVAFLMTRSDPNWFYAFVPGDLAAGRGPRASAEALKAVLYDEDASLNRELAAFAASLFSHNSGVALLCFAVGVLFCLLTGLLLLYNGAMLGAFLAIYHDKGLLLDMVAWLSIHGVTELSAIAIAAAGGMRMGLAWLFPGVRSRSDALKLAGRDATKLAVLAVIMLLVAGLLEGIGRQVVTNLWLRLAIGWGFGLAWLAWLVLAGRDRRAARPGPAAVTDVGGALPGTDPGRATPPAPSASPPRPVLNRRFQPGRPSREAR